MQGILSSTMRIRELSCEQGVLTGIEQLNSGKPRILAVHGWLDNAASFIPLMQMMPDYDWFALDFSGHGQSAHHAPGHSYHFADYMIDIERAAEQLGWESFVLLGHSLGANVASMYAAAKPEQVEKLIMIDGFAVFAHEAEAALTTLRRAFATRKKYQRDCARIYPSLQRLIERRCDVGDVSQASAQLLIEYACRAHPDGVELLSDQRLKQSSFFYLTPAQVETIFNGVESASMLIRGRQGLLPPLEKMQRLIDAIAELETVELEGNHHLHMDNAKSVAECIQQFIRG